MVLGQGIVFTAVAVMFAAVMLPEVAAVRYIVGGNMGWTTNFNYTVWAQSKHFYNGDWLFFVYDRDQMNVLEVNRGDYDNCSSDHPLHNWTTGAGRDVVPLNVTKTYYFISGKGFCFGGMKVAIHVENRPRPPRAAPIMSAAAAPVSTPPAEATPPAAGSAPPMEPPAKAPAPSKKRNAPALAPELLGTPPAPPATASGPNADSISRNSSPTTLNQESQLSGAEKLMSVGSLTVVGALVVGLLLLF